VMAGDRVVAAITLDDTLRGLVDAQAD
jgi:hypothetical protein